MSILTEVTAQPQYRHNHFAEFESLFLQFAVSLPPTYPLRHQLAPLCRDLCEIMRSLDVAGLDQINDRWERWRDKFTALSDPVFGKQLEDLFTKCIRVPLLS